MDTCPVVNKLSLDVTGEGRDDKHGPIYINKTGVERVRNPTKDDN